MAKERRKFKEGDIVTFFESLLRWVVLGYKMVGYPPEMKVVVRRIRVPSQPHLKEVLGYADEEDLILS